MRILAIEKEIASDKYNKSLLKNEALKIYNLYKKGKVREIFFTKRDHSAIIILEVKNISEAKTLINSLPLVQKKLIDFELIELIPYDGYDRIIK